MHVDTGMPRLIPRGGGGLQDRGEERLLQHAGQDACGLVKADGTSTYIKMHGHSWTQARLGGGVA